MIFCLCDPLATIYDIMEIFSCCGDDLKRAKQQNQILCHRAAFLIFALLLLLSQICRFQLLTFVLNSAPCSSLNFLKFPIWLICLKPRSL